MSKPRRQHFIPKSYLRNFADIEGDKAFVEVMNVNSNAIQYPFSLNNICVSKNIYTFPDTEEEDKYLLEKFYAENIDGVYPEVYDILTNPLVVNITDDQRIKILNVCLSLFFRNAKFLEEKNDEFDWWLGRLKDKALGKDDADLVMQFGGHRYSFKMGDIESVRERAMLNHRMDFIIRHFHDWQNFIQFKKSSQICVTRIIGDIELITSDNPVSIYNQGNQVFRLFDADNAIQLPLDQRHILWISPNDEDVQPNIIYRGLRDKWFALTSNHEIKKQASEWIIGKKGCITKYLEQHNQHDTFTPENIQALEDIKIRTSELTKFIEFAENNGGITSEVSICKLRELKKIPAVANDPQFKYMCLQLVLKGYTI